MPYVRSRGENSPPIEVMHDGPVTRSPGVVIGGPRLDPCMIRQGKERVQIYIAKTR